MIDSLASFDQLISVARTVDGGVSTIRKLILRMAVRGKLTDRVCNSESATDLVERLDAASGVEALDSNAADDGPYEIPESWQWVSLKRFGTFAGGGTPSKRTSNYWGGDLPWVTPKDMKQRELADAIDHITYDGLANSSAKLIDENALLMVIRGMILVHTFPVAIACRSLTINQDMKSLTLHLPEMADYLVRYLEAEQDRVLELVKRSSHGTCRIPADDLAEFMVALPSRAEQQAIVAKVDKLMCLCDRLEQSLAEERGRRAELTKESFSSLVSSCSTRAVRVRWGDLAGKLHSLVVDSPSCHQLRETIVSLAVTGRLDAETRDTRSRADIAEELDDARERAIAESNGRRRKPLGKEQIGTPLFAAPDGWVWTHFDHVADLAGGVTKGRKLGGRDTARFPYLRVANVQRWRVDLDVMKEIEIPVDELSKYRLEPNDLLLTEGGDWDKLGRTAIWKGEIENCLHQNHVFRGRLYSTRLLPEWLMLVTNSLVGRRYFESASKKTTNLASINMTQLRGFPIPVPPYETQLSIIERTRQLLKRCDDLAVAIEARDVHAAHLLESL